MTAFSFGLMHVGPEYVLTIGGDVDASVANTVIELADVALADDTCEALVVDMTAVTFLDSTGLGALLAVRNDPRSQVTGMTLRSVPPRVARLLKLSGLEEIFDVDDQPSEAAPDQRP